MALAPGPSRAAVRTGNGTKKTSESPEGPQGGGGGPGPARTASWSCLRSVLAAGGRRASGTRTDRPVQMRGGGRRDTCHVGGVEVWAGLDASCHEWVGLNLDRHREAWTVRAGRSLTSGQQVAAALLISSHPDQL